MADNLVLKVRLDTSQADKALDRLFRSMTKIDKALTGSSRGLKSLSAESTKAASSLTKVEKATKGTKAGLTEIEKASRKAGSIFQRSFQNGLSVLSRVRDTALLVGSAIGGIGAGKMAQEYLAFSKQIGAMNGTIMVSGKNLHKLQSQILGIAGASAQNPENVTVAMTRMFSTQQFDPLQGGEVMEGSDEYFRRVDMAVGIMQGLGRVSVSTGEDLQTLTDAFIKYGATFNMPIENMEHANQVFDEFVGLLKYSQGGLGELVPEFGKFGKQLTSVGMSRQQALASFAVLTNSFDVPEAGTRASALGRFMEGSVDTIKKVKKATGINLTDTFFSYDPKTKTRTRRNVTDVLTGIKSLIETRKDDYTRGILETALFGEIREASAVRTLGQDVDDMIEATRGMENVSGMADKAYSSATEAVGVRWELLMSNFQSARLAFSDVIFGIVADIDNLNSVNPEEFSETMDIIAQNLKDQVGPQFAGIVDKVKEFTLYLNSKEGRQNIKSIGDGLMRMGTALATIGDLILKVFSNPLVQKTLNWLASHPEVAIGIGLVGIPGLKAILGATIGTAISAALQLAFKGILASGIWASAGGMFLAVVTNPAVWAVVAATILTGLAADKKKETDKVLAGQSKQLGKIENNAEGGAKLLEGADDSRVGAYLKKQKELAEYTRKYADANINQNIFEAMLGGSAEVNVYKHLAEKAQRELDQIGLGLTGEEVDLAQRISGGRITVDDTVKHYADKGGLYTRQAAIMTQNRINTRVSNAGQHAANIVQGISNPASLIPQIGGVYNAVKGSDGMQDAGQRIVNLMTEPFAKLAGIPDMQKQVVEYNAKAKEDMESAKAALVSAAGQMVSAIQNGVGNLKLNIAIPGLSSGGAHAPSGNSASQSGGARNNY